MTEQAAIEMGFVGAVLVIIAAVNLFPLGALLVTLLFGAAGALVIRMAVDESKTNIYGE